MNETWYKYLLASVDQVKLPFLSDDEIRKLLKSGELVIHPILEIDQISGTKIDLRLDNAFHLVQRIAMESYDPSSSVTNKYLVKHSVQYGTPFILHPGELVLAPTFESIKMPPNILGLLDGRSSLARVGVLVHATAGTVDPNFNGSLIVELLNVGRVPVKLFPLMRIGAVHLAMIKGMVETTYDKVGKYQGFENILDPRSKLHKDRDWNSILSMESLST